MPMEHVVLRKTSGRRQPIERQGANDQRSIMVELAKSFLNSLTIDGNKISDFGMIFDLTKKTTTLVLTQRMRLLFPNPNYQYLGDGTWLPLVQKVAEEMNQFFKANSIHFRANFRQGKEWGYDRAPDGPLYYGSSIGGNGITSSIEIKKID